MILKCSILFQSDEYVTKILKLACTTEWMGTYIEIDLRRPRVELVVIIGKLFEDNALEKGEECEYIPIKPTDNVENILHSTLRKGYHQH